MQVNYRYSDTDFIAYLMTLGYKYNQIVIERDKYKQLKAYVYFSGEKDELINIYNDYCNDKIMVKALSYSKHRKQICKMIKSEILQYQVGRIESKNEE
jgi:hypothetical protein